MFICMCAYYCCESSKQMDPNPKKNSSENTAADEEWNSLYVDVSFLIKELSLGLGSRCLLLNSSRIAQWRLVCFVVTSCCRELLFLPTCRKETKASCRTLITALTASRARLYLTTLPQAVTINIPGNICSVFCVCCLIVVVCCIV